MQEEDDGTFVVQRPIEIKKVPVGKLQALASQGNLRPAPYEVGP